MGELSVEEKCIEIIKRNNRLFMVSKDELFKMLKNSFGKYVVTSDEKLLLMDYAYDLLTVETLPIFEKCLRKFGIIQADIAEVLGISSYRVKKCIEEGKIKCADKYKQTGGGALKITYHIFRVSDVAKLFQIEGAQFKPSREKQAEVVEATDHNLAEALYLINKSAKVSRDTKNTNYRRSVCCAARTRMQNHYYLKDCVMKKLIMEKRMKYVGINKQIIDGGDCNFLIQYELDGFSFHVPYDEKYGEIDEEEILPGCITEIISAEKRRDISLNYKQAVALLENYTGESVTGTYNRKYF